MDTPETLVAEQVEVVKVLNGWSRDGLPPPSPTQGPSRGSR
jgi:hypothetical protein